MKKKMVYLSIIIFLCVFLIGIICINKNYNIIMKDDYMLALTLDGDSISTFPNYNNGAYTVKINCNNGVKGKFLPVRESTTKEYKVAIEETSKKVKCYVDFKTKTNMDLLKSKVETEGTSGIGSIVHETFTSEGETIDAGYRYEGQNPNNYVWFNNELWRIIGSIPIAGDENNRLVKIIRTEKIGSLAYNTSNTTAQIPWGNNTLYTLLNTYYYGASNRTKDATNTDHCFGNGNYAKAHCDYSTIGIDSNSYYGQMVMENVLWNIGASDQVNYVNDVYLSEKSTTTTGTIGLMSASDYGYATSASHTENKLSEYNNADHTLGNWLYGQGYEWINIQCSRGGGTLSIYVSGNVDKQNVTYGYATRPVLYLNSGVYVVSGTGTISDPYILAI